MSTLSRPYLGTGLGFPVTADAAGALNVAAYEDSVSQAIWIILATARGERRMRPDFGCGINDLVFQNNNAATAGRVSREVNDALLRFEPRVEVLNVQVSAADGGATMLVDIAYRIRTTNNVFNMVYPFYLDGGVTA
jgi:phage baseplate assembly protein W